MMQMLNWKRTKYLARGCFIQEVATTGKQTIVAEWVIKNGKPAPRAKYYQDNVLIKGFNIEAIDIEELKIKAYIAVREYINEQIADWSGALYDFWKEECWEDDVDD